MAIAAEDEALFSLINFMPSDSFYDVYLAQKGLKPASCVYIHIGMECEGIEEKTKKRLSETNCIMEKAKLKFKPKIKKKQIEIKPSGSQESHFITQIYIEYLLSSTEEGLGRIIAADSLKCGRYEFYKEFGTALGYPDDSINLFASLMKNELSPVNFDKACILEAIKKGAVIPSWIAYLPYCCRVMDINNESGTSSLLGKKYMTFVRKNEPHLANQIEGSFAYEVMQIPNEKHIVQLASNLPIIRSIIAADNSERDIYTNIMRFSDEMTNAYSKKH